MRRVHALAAACATVLPVSLLAGCAGRPNDLYTYYDDAPPSATATVAPAASPGSAAPTTTTSAEPEHAEAVALAALSATDLAAEEVRADGPPDTSLPAALSDCGIRLGPGTEPGRRTTWKYASGSQLRQQVAYAQDAAGVVDAARDSLDCVSFRVDGVVYQIDEGAGLGPMPGVDDRLTWCASGLGKVTCTILLARGSLVTAVTVEAGTLSRARSAIVRIAPKAAAALARGF